MNTSKNKQRLPLELRKLTTKLFSLFFKKLILLEEEQYSHNKVQHYDLQCEGVEMLRGFFKTKHQNTLLKGFVAIRNFSPSKSQQTPQCMKNYPNGNTGRTYLNTSYSVYESQPTSYRPPTSIKSLRDHLNSKDGQARSHCSGNMEKLLKKVKETNSRKDLSFRESLSNRTGENCGFCLNQRSHNILTSPSFLDPSRVKAPSYSGPSTSFYSYQQRSFNNVDRTNQNCYEGEKSSRRGSRREFILDKFNNIENGLNLLQDRKETRCRLNNEIMNEILTIKQRLRL